MLSCPPEISSHTFFAGSSVSRVCDTYASFTVSPTRSVPPSGRSSPVMRRKSVVLPAPFGPMIPTMAPRGRENVSPSKRSLSPYALRSFVASTTTSPSRGPRSEEHTSELQSRFDLVCRLLLEKKKKKEHKYK